MTTSISNAVVCDEPHRYRLIGVPTSYGALFTGTEFAAAAYRETGLLSRLRAAGVAVFDAHDLDIPSFLPRHNTPPIRNWPSPRIVWERTAAAVSRAYEAGDVALLVGGDCSVVVGVVNGIAAVDGSDIHLVYLDGHVDAVAPRGDSVIGAAATGLWFLTNPNPLWPGHLLSPEAITVIGCSDLQGADGLFTVIDAGEVRADPVAAAQRVLDRVDESDRIVVHFDIDVLSADEMPAAYSPNENGLSSKQVGDVLATIMRDPRIVALEVTEYTVQRDLDGRYAERVVSLLAEAL